MLSQSSIRAAHSNALNHFSSFPRSSKCMHNYVTLSAQSRYSRAKMADFYRVINTDLSGLIKTSKYKEPPPPPPPPPNTLVFPLTKSGTANLAKEKILHFYLQFSFNPQTYGAMGKGWFHIRFFQQVFLGVTSNSCKPFVLIVVIAYSVKIYWKSSDRVPNIFRV